MNASDHLNLCQQVVECVTSSLVLTETATHYRSAAVIRACVYAIEFTVESDEGGLLIMTMFEAVNGSNIHKVVFSEAEVANSLAIYYNCKAYKLVDGRTTMILASDAKILITKMKGGITNRIDLGDGSTFISSVFRHDKVFYRVEYVIEPKAFGGETPKSALCITSFEKMRMFEMAVSEYNEAQIANLLAVGHRVDLYLLLDGSHNDASEETFVNQPGQRPS